VSLDVDVDGEPINIDLFVGASAGYGLLNADEMKFSINESDADKIVSLLGK
jgi:hypothetical protein